MELQLPLTLKLFAAIRADRLLITSIHGVIINNDFFIRVDGIHEMLRVVILFRRQITRFPSVSVIEKRCCHRLLVSVKLINHRLLDLVGVVLALITLWENCQIAYSYGFVLSQRGEIEIFELEDFMQGCHFGFTVGVLVLGQMR